MKKKSVFVLVVLIVLVSACVPEAPQDIPKYCQDEYEKLLVIDPDFPPAFIGACISSLQTDNIQAFKALCGYEPFWQELSPVGITSRKDCIQFLNEYEPE